MTFNRLSKMVAWSLLLSAAVSAAGPASDGGDVPGSLERLINPTVGQWVLYRVLDASSNQQLTVRQSIVGKKMVADRDAYWVETDIMSREGGRIIRKTLIAINPTGADRILQLVEKAGSEPARIVPVPHQPKTTEKPAGQKPAVEDIGEETLITPAGSIRTRHVRVTSPQSSQDVWTNDEVGLSGMVKSVSETGQMELIAYGKTGATSAIIEQPLEMDVQQDVQNPEPEVSAGENEP